VCVLRVRPRAQRLNDLDDAVYEAMRMRERPLPLSMPYPAMPGIALCVVAMAGTPEQRARQAIELSRAAAKFEVYSGIRFMLWDVTEVLWTPPGVTAPTGGAASPSGASPGGAKAGGLAGAIAKSTGNAYTAAAVAGSLPNQHQQQQQQQQQARREKLGKLLESVKGMIPSTAFPALLVLDLFKRRYYQTRLGLTGSVYAAEQITQFCDDYSKGGLNDLLPPVKGCRVFGGSVVRTKYALIAV